MANLLMADIYSSRMQPLTANNEPLPSFAGAYANQRSKMISFVRQKARGKHDAEDIVDEAWTRALETYDSSKGLQIVQWAWYVLQHNTLPAYWRRERIERDVTERTLDDPNGDWQTATTGGEDETAKDAAELLSFIRGKLPPDLLRIFDVMQKITVEKDSSRIYSEVARELNIPLRECRNLVKRLRRKCQQLKTIYNR